MGRRHHRELRTATTTTITIRLPPPTARANVVRHLVRPNADSLHQARRAGIAVSSARQGSSTLTSGHGAITTFLLPQSIHCVILRVRASPASRLFIPPGREIHLHSSPSPQTPRTLRAHHRHSFTTFVNPPSLILYSLLDRLVCTSCILCLLPLSSKSIAPSSSLGLPTRPTPARLKPPPVYFTPYILSHRGHNSWISSSCNTQLLSKTLGRLMELASALTTYTIISGPQKAQQ